MRLSLLCVWVSCICAPLTEAEKRPQREEGALQPGHTGRRRHPSSGPSPSPSPVKEQREAGGTAVEDRRRAAASGHPRCGHNCCARMSPKTRKCTKPRCFPRCHNGGLCRWGNRCVCGRGFHGSRCEFSSVTVSLPGHPLTSIFPTILSPQYLLPPGPSPFPQSVTTPAQHHTTTVTAILNPLVEVQGPEVQESLILEQSRAEDKGPVTTEQPQTQTQTESKPEFNDLQPWDRDSKDKEEGDGNPGSQTKDSPTQNLQGSESEGHSQAEGESTIPHTHSVERLTTDKTPNSKSNIETEFNPKSESDVEKAGLKTGDGEGGTEVESEVDNQKTPDPESSPELREEMDVRAKQTKVKEVDNESRGAKKQLLSLREAQAVLLRKTLQQRGRGDKMAALLLKHIEKERKKLRAMSYSSNSSSSTSASTSAASVKTSVRSFHTQKGQYTVHITAPAVLCPLLCKNGGVCLQRDRCLCPPNFTGKFCQIPVTPVPGGADSAGAPQPSPNEIFRPVLLSSSPTNQDVTQTEFLLPLGPNQEVGRPGAPSPSMVKVRVQHPPEASVKIHQVLKMSGHSPTLQTVSFSPSSGSAGAPAPPRVGVLAQTVRGDGTYTEHSAFKYCFREIKDGQCSSPLPGLRSKEMCCRGLGKGWGITDCVRCPENTGQSNSSCPSGFERANGTQCVDVNECLHPGLCENGICVNTRGSYSCVCRAGFILDASHGICISQTVISEEKGQCHRVLGAGLGPSSCSLPILRNITKQICCCSRVGKAWGPDCERCPYFGSVEFKEICPAGPGYYYSASALQFTQRVNEQLGDQGVSLVTQSNQGILGPHSGSIGSGSSRSQLTPSTAGDSVSRLSNPAISNPAVSNPAVSNPAVSNPAVRNPAVSNPAVRNPAVSNPAVSNPTVRNPAVSNPTVRNPAVSNPAVSNPAVSNPTVRNPAVSNPAVSNPAVRNPAVSNPAVRNPAVSNPAVSHPAVSNPVVSNPAVRNPAVSSPAVRNPAFGSGSGAAGATGTQTRPSPPQSQPRQPYTPQSRPPTSLPSTRSQGSGSTNILDKSQTSGRTVTQQNRPESAPSSTTQLRPQPPSTGSQAGSRASPVSQPVPPSGRGDSLPAPAQPQSHETVSTSYTGRSEELRPVPRRPALSPTTRPITVQAVRSVCDSRPGVCGRGRCVDQPDGKHTCVCDQGYQPNAQRTYCQDVNECELNPCRNARCENTLGSYKCVCRLGYRLTGNTCADVDECADPLQCPGQECINSQGSYRCRSCQPGYAPVNRRCTDIDECRQTPCANSHCENTPGSYRCVCLHGYKLHNNTCTDIDECAEPSQCPGQQCVNTEGSYHCVSCRPGYRLVNRKCTDVNECENSRSCPGRQCVNTEGSYSCVACQQGYHIVNGVCTDVDECKQASQCPGQQCFNTIGSYRCVSCQPGYHIKDGTCQDVDECASSGACEAQRVCVNTVGSYKCDCPPGYRTNGLGRQCRDINECLEGDFCFSGGECQNTPGSYTCVCSPGYILSNNGTSCLDVDECAQSRLCLDGRCINTDGSFRCDCRPGFTANPEKTSCLDVDECVSSGGTVCGSRRCENTLGSYRCVTSCEPGYKVTQTGSCVDINECVNKTVCGEHAVCQNLLGTYQCVCDQGFTSTADGKACVDEDECVSLRDVCGSARCENVEGSFMCECDHGEFDHRTRKCVSTAPPAEVVPDNPSSSSSSSSSSSFSTSSHTDVTNPVLPPLPAARPGELRECYYNLAERGTCTLLANNTSQQECCCTVGEGWGLRCQYHACPSPDTAEFLSLCPSGRGYITTGPAAFSYRDVDECKRFHPEVCKNGVCVNNIPGYNCYCSNGYVYNSSLLECVDHDECEEETCVGGTCVNTMGSFYCSCPPPSVLDDTQRNCINSSDLTVDENLSMCWQQVSADLMCQSPLIGVQFTFTDCCCLYGQGWGMECALCPASDTEDYAFLCSSYHRPDMSSYPDSTGSDTGVRPGRGRASTSPHFPTDSFPPYSAGIDYPRPDYDDYSPAGGSRSTSVGGGGTGSISLPDGAYLGPEYGAGFYTDGDYRSPEGSPPRTPSFHIPPDPRSETAFGTRPLPPRRPDGPPLSLAPLPGSPYMEHEEEEEEEEVWRPGPPFPPFRGGGIGGTPRRVYERRYEPYAGLSTADDCGILHGCENGRCIRVAEGYTCDCYPGYELDMTSMTCIDVNECEGSVRLEYPCVNSRCVNTDGSFRCVCRRGYVMSRRPNHCVAA